MKNRLKTFLALAAKISANLRRLYNEHLADFEVKGPHLFCLYFIYKDRALLNKDLSEFCEEDLLIIGSSLDFLQAEGYIVSENGKKQLSEKGIAIGRQLEEKVDPVIEQVCEGVCSEDRIIFTSVLTLISDRLEEQT